MRARSTACLLGAALELQFQEVAHERLDDLAGQPLDLVHLALEAFQGFTRVQGVRGRCWMEFEEALDFVVGEVRLG